MKRLSISLPAIALALVLALSGAALTPHSTPAATPAIYKPSATSLFQYYYYWYTEPDDLYNDYTTLANEEWEWWVYFGGAVINTSPTGGTLIAEGYMNNHYPHDMYPAAYLYAHLTYDPGLAAQIKNQVREALTPSKH
jgi:hypothetical protein